MSDMDKHHDTGRCYSEPRPDGSDQGRCPVKLMIGQTCCHTPQVPIQLAQCRFCGGPGHAYGERCGRELSGRPSSLTSPSARLGYAIAQLRGLRQLNAEYIDVAGAALTPKGIDGMLVHTINALDAVHEALADLYTGRF